MTFKLQPPAEIPASVCLSRLLEAADGNAKAERVRNTLFSDEIYERAFLQFMKHTPVVIDLLQHAHGQGVSESLRAFLGGDHVDLKKMILADFRAVIFDDKDGFNPGFLAFLKKRSTVSDKGYSFTLTPPKRQPEYL
jgi:hypothetical protein